MRESEVEAHLKWAVERVGGQTFKFKSVNHRGVSDRIACFPSGRTWFVELKRPGGGKLSKLQELFAADMIRLKQNYALLASKQEIDIWILTASL